MAKFKNQDILLDDNEQIIFGTSQDAAMYWDTSDLIVNKNLKHLTEGYYATREYVKGVVAGLEWQDSVISATTDIPGSPVYGDRYIIPSGASGAWSGLDDDIAEYTTTWGYVTPSAGFSTWVNDISAWYVYDGSNWINFSGKIDHGTLKGLADDDHSAYPLVTNFESDRATIATNWTDLTDAGETALHIHDDRYYTETEVDTLVLAASANAADVAMDYTDTEIATVTSLTLEASANAADVAMDYTDTEIATTVNTQVLAASANAADVAMDYTDSELTTHEGAADPHTGYVLADGSRDMTGTLSVSGNINSSGDIEGVTFSVNGTPGSTGWFDDGTNFRITVTEGLITTIGASVSGGYSST